MNNSLHLKGSRELSSSFPACTVNSELGACSTGDSSVTISLWYSLRPDGGLNHRNDGCVLLTAGGDSERQIKVK